MTSMLLTLILVCVFQLLFTSWCWILLIPLVLGFLEKDSAAKAAFANGFGVFLAWFGMALFQWLKGGEIIVSRVAELMALGSGLMLALLTGFLGFLVAALAGYTGFTLRRLLLKEYQIS